MSTEINLEWKLLEGFITELIVNKKVKSKRVRLACEQFISEAENINDEVDTA